MSTAAVKHWRLVSLEQLLTLLSSSTNTSIDEGVDESFQVDPSRELRTVSDLAHLWPAMEINPIAKAKQTAGSGRVPPPPPPPTEVINVGDPRRSPSGKAGDRPPGKSCMGRPN